ncbi:outer membrane protein [Novosphingobium sp. 9]|uniref:outer membrane protein n=1 Tax=Novosphingobium sp. 9 TaxID=2025349 RepID=UPI0021B50F03|nr:outer membrane beta-barrel protein [Novosphingobium sp. 9]
MKSILTAGAALVLAAVPHVANAQAWVQAETGVDVVHAEGETRANIAYGVSGGYDYQMQGGIFVGAMGSFGDSETRACVSDDGDRACIKTGRDLAALVRLGTTVGERSKVYLLGGYTNARAIASASVDGTHVEAHKDLDGFRLGAGGQVDLTSKLFLKAEYRYSNYQYGVSRHQGVVALGVNF